MKPTPFKLASAGASRARDYLNLVTKQNLGQPPGNYRELGWFLAAFMAAIAAILAMGGSALWLRQPWLDERCCTLYAIDASNPIQVVTNVVHGDVAPPLLHLIIWAVTRVTGTAIPVLRSIPLVGMGGAFLFVYLALRRRFGVGASAAGVLSLATQGLIVEHAFEIRFYGFWVMFCAMYAWSLEIDAGRPSRRRDIAVAALSVGVCLIHWFGIISLGGMALAVVLAHRHRWRQRLRLVAPGVAGISMLVLLIPLFVTQVRSAGSSVYWIPPLNLGQIEETVVAFLAFPVLVLAIALVAQRLPWANAAPARALLDPSLIALIGGIAMPVALVLISAVAKPVVWPRYGIVGVLALAPVVALGVETLPRLHRMVVIGALLVIAGFRVNREARTKATFKGAVDAFQGQLLALRQTGVPIVFQSYFLQYPVDGASRRESVTRFLDLPDSTINALRAMPSWQSGLLVRDRNMVRVHERTFGFPLRATQAQLERIERFYLFAADDNLPVGYKNSIEFGKMVFPNHRAVRLNKYVTLFERAENP